MVPIQRFSAQLPTDGPRRTIRDAIFTEAMASFGYTLLVPVLGSQPEGLIGGAVGWWVDETVGVSETLLFLIPVPNGFPEDVSAHQVATYRHILAVSILLAMGCLAASRKRWPYWASRTTLSLVRLLGGRWAARKAALTGYRRMVLGLVAVTLLLFFLEARAGTTAAFLYSQSWTFLRAPLFATAAFAFTCYAAVFRQCALWRRDNR
ncbi:hypothetical protein SAMN05216304_101759 [Bosea sp. OK403]|uniref:hypothetical protein n=1 Tax=Bosea sp. OK403 TaxID=1855286 RepID=UPI0008EEBC3D|nr:hypothetical protein [Bosea sp. OK403]SFI08330.1 hypothetical protein SAMN05216304_101759 [Bosea sp. OK403]